MRSDGLSKSHLFKFGVLDDDTILGRAVQRRGGRRRGPPTSLVSVAAIAYVSVPPLVSVPPPQHGNSAQKGTGSVLWQLRKKTVTSRRRRVTVTSSRLR